MRSLGAEVFFDITKYTRDEEGTQKLANDLRATTPQGLGAAAVVVCTGSKAAYAQAMSFLRFYGTLVCVGLPEGDVEPIPGAVPGLLVAGGEENRGQCCWQPEGRH